MGAGGDDPATPPAAAAGAAAAPRVWFDDVSAPIEAGRDVLATLLDARAPIAYLCMAGSCGTCRIRVRAGAEHLVPPTRPESRMLVGAPVDERLACQAIFTGGGDVVVDQDFSAAAGG